MNLPRILSSVGPDLAFSADAARGRSQTSTVEVRFGSLVADSATMGEEPTRGAAFSCTENVAWSERVVQNISPLSDSPLSVARAIRESYGRYLSARPSRFHAHA